MATSFIVTSTEDTAGDTRTGSAGSGAESGSQVGTLRQAINYANANPGTTITFALSAGATITLGAELPLILGDDTIIDGALPSNTTVTIDGGSTGATSGYRVFFVGDAGQIPDTGTNLGQGTTHAIIENLTIQHANARGGNGTQRGSGGAGLGGAVFVSSTGDVTLTSVALSSNRAIGGSGGLSGYIFAGGGGLGGNGGSSGSGGGGGGGFGSGASGGDATSGSAGAFTGGASGGASGSNAGGVNGGGGAGEPNSTHFGGGGGGVGGQTSPSDGTGGMGGFGGGGGSGDAAAAETAAGGAGGFGGGGGGGGGQSGNSDNAGGQGGGGLGAGGGIFVEQGGTLTFDGGLTIDGNTVAGGTGAKSGSMFGAGLFLQGTGAATALTFQPDTGQTQTISDVIADQTGSGGSGTYASGGTGPGNGGSYSGAGSYTLIKDGAGTLKLSAANTYTGGTTLGGGRLELAGPTTVLDSGDGVIASGSAGTGPITFGTGPATLQVDSAAFYGSGLNESLVYALTGFAQGDAVNLTNITSTSAQLSYQNGVLTVRDTNGQTDQITIDQPAGTQFSLVADATGVDVVATATSSPPAPPPPPSPAPTAPTISGTHATADTAERTVTPFGAAATGGPVVIGDGNAGATDGLVITLSGAGGTLAGQGLTGSGSNYALAATDPATLSSELDALRFTPSNGTPNAVATTTFTLTATSSAGTAATDGGTTVTDTAPAVAPTVTGGQADQQTTNDAPVHGVLAGVTVADDNAGLPTETLAITLGGAGGTLSGGGVTPGSTSGTYTLTGSLAQVNAVLAHVTFTPVAGQPGSTAVTTFSIVDTSSASATASAADTTPSVSAVDPIPDTVSISPQVSYTGGVFTLSGTASSPAGVSSVEISALVNGVRQDVGAAALNPDGTFLFQDAAGDQQAFFVATETDASGGQATSADPGFNLTGGLGPQGRYGQQETFDAVEQLSTAVYRPNGQRFLSLAAPGQTVDLRFDDVVAAHVEGGNTFVFTEGVGTDVVGGFKLSGADHDTLQLPASDFRNFAAVLRDTTYAGGSANIFDPTTGDSIVLQGVTEAALKAHPKDFAFV